MADNKDRGQMVIHGKLHIEGADGLYHMQPLGMDDARAMKGKESPAYAVQDGKPFRAVNGTQYAGYLENTGMDSVMAEKSGGIIVRKAVQGEEIPVYSQNGILEASETGVAGKWVATKADSDGKPVVDEYGHENTWQISDETFRKKYAAEGDVKDGSFVKPAGGEQQFIKTDRDVAVMVPWGKDGALVPQCIEKGGWLNITDKSDVYGISARDFEDTYDVKGPAEKNPVREMEQDSVNVDKSMQNTPAYGNDAKALSGRDVNMEPKGLDRKAIQAEAESLGDDFASYEEYQAKFQPDLSGSMR